MCVFLCTENNISWAIICLVYWRLLINFKVISSFQFSDKIIIHLMFSLLVGPHLTITPALRDDTLFVVVVSRWNWTSPLVSCPLLCVISFFFFYSVLTMSLLAQREPQQPGVMSVSGDQHLGHVARQVGTTCVTHYYAFHTYLLQRLLLEIQAIYTGHCCLSVILSNNLCSRGNFHEFCSSTVLWLWIFCYW